MDKRVKESPVGAAAVGEETVEGVSKDFSQSAPHHESPRDFDYDLRFSRWLAHRSVNHSGTNTDSLDIFQSIDSSQFLESVGDVKHSTSGSWLTVNSSFEQDAGKTCQDNDDDKKRKNITTLTESSVKSIKNQSEIDDSSYSSIKYYSCDALKSSQEMKTGELEAAGENFQCLSRSDSSVTRNQVSGGKQEDHQQHNLRLGSIYDTIVEKTDHLDGGTRRFEIRKNSRPHILSNNHFRRTNFLKNKYTTSNHRHNSNNDMMELISKPSCTLKRTATEHMSNRCRDENLIDLSQKIRYHPSSVIYHPNDSIIIPDNAIIIRRKSIIRCLLPRQHSDTSKVDLNQNQHYQTDYEGKDQLFAIQNNDSHESGSRLGEYRISENLKSSFEKEDENKAENLLEREAHIGALALAWASGTHKSRKSAYEKHTNHRRNLYETTQRKLRRYNNNKSTTVGSNSKTNLSTLRELSASIFSSPKRSPLLSYTPHPRDTQQPNVCHSNDETSNLENSSLILPDKPHNYHNSNKTNNGLWHQKTMKTIINDTAKIAISPIICSSGEQDASNRLSRDTAYYNSMDSMPERCLPTCKQNDKRFISLSQLEQTNQEDDDGQELLPNEPSTVRQSYRQQQQMKLQESQQTQSKKSSLVSEQTYNVGDISESDDEGSTRPIGIRAKIRRNAEDLRPLYGTGGPLGSVQPQVNYKAQNRGIGWRLHWRKIFNERRRKIADYSLFFAVMGILLMVFELELIMAKVYLKTSIYSMLMKSLISASTLILVGLTLVYHAVDIQLFCINNCIEDWRIALNCRKISLTLIEVFICLVHPPPILSNYNIYAYNSAYHTSSSVWSFKQANDVVVDNSLLSSNELHNTHYSRPITTPIISSTFLSSSSDNSTYRLVDLPFPTVPITSNHNDISSEKIMPMVTLELTLSVPMFLRLYLIFRVLLLHSTMFTDAGSRSIGALNRVKINVRFVLKTLATVCPGTMLLIFILSMWIVTSWIMRVCEREQNKEYEKLLNSMWLIAVTFLSIGYGDMVPNTNCGRAISVLAGVMGSACTALVVAVVARKLELTRAEKHVHNFMQDNKFYKNLRHSAANVLRETWLFYKYTRLVKRVKPARVRRHQRKFLTAISRLRKAKDSQRKLKEEANSMVDLAKLQTSIYDTVNYIRADQTIFVQRLVAVEKCMSSIQAYVNQMSDTFTGIIDTLGTCSSTTVPLEDEALAKINLSPQPTQPTQQLSSSNESLKG